MHNQGLGEPPEVIEADTAAGAKPNRRGWLRIKQCSKCLHHVFFLSADLGRYSQTRTMRCHVIGNAYTDIFTSSRVILLPEAFPFWIPQFRVNWCSTAMYAQFVAG